MFLVLERMLLGVLMTAIESNQLINIFIAKTKMRAKIFSNIFESFKKIGADLSVKSIADNKLIQ